jgi:hypothetical protein
VVLALVALGFFLIQGLAADELPSVGLAGLVDNFLVLSLIMTLLGIVVAWHWEGIGAVLIAGSVLLFTGINAIQQGSWHFNVLVLFSLAVAALFGWDWWRSERAHGEPRSARPV